MVRDMIQRLAYKTLSKIRALTIRARVKSFNSKAAYIASKNENLLMLIAQQLPPDLFDDFVETLQKAYQYRFDMKKRKLIDKFNRIMVAEYNDYRKRRGNLQKWFLNLTEVQVPEHVADVLALGNKFAAPSNLENSHIVDIVANIEASIYHFDPTPILRQKLKYETKL